MTEFVTLTDPRGGDMPRRTTRGAPGPSGGRVGWGEQEEPLLSVCDRGGVAGLGGISGPRAQGCPWLCGAWPG